MGMYDHLNNITRTLQENQKREELKTTTATINQQKKYNLISLLFDEIREAEEEGFNLYSDITKDRIITNVLHFEDTPTLNNIDFTRYFLEANYYKLIAKNKTIQKAEQKQTAQTQKEQLQTKKLQLQIEALEEKKKAQQQKQIELTQQQKIDLAQIIKILFYIFIIPIGIIGGFFVECAKASARSGTRRV